MFFPWPLFTHFCFPTIYARLQALQFSNNCMCCPKWTGYIAPFIYSKWGWDCDTESPFSQAKRFAWTKIGFKLPSHTYNDAQAIAAFMCCFAKCFYGSPRFKMQIVVRKAALRSGVIKWNPPKGTKSTLQKIKGAYFLYAIIHIPRYNHMEKD